LEGKSRYGRYLSKNNANIARLPLLKVLFPEAKFVIPVRNPWDHVASLQRQHERFLKLHQQDRYGRQYMEWLGHFEFGANLKPVDFANWRDEISLGPDDRDFWLTYWIKTFEQVLNQIGPNVLLVSYTRLCDAPRYTLEALGRGLSVNEKLLGAQARMFRPPAHSEQGPDTGDLSARAGGIYEALLDKAIT